MINFKNALTKMGLVEEEITVARKPAPTQGTATAPGVSAPVSYTPMAQYTPAPTVDPTIQDMLTQSLQDNKLAGFDYLKFAASVEEMKAFGAAEDARYKMAYSTAKQMGVDKNNLLKSGQHYLDVLTQDEADFNQDCNEYDKKEIQSRDAKISQIQTSIADLTKQLTQLQQDGLQLQQESQTEKMRLESRKSAFQMTLQVFRATIESNIQKINQYL